MAIDNLNYYSSWLPAWQLTDKYSSQPWCLKSKNLDIFSSSKSVKATAWSNPTTTDADIVKQDWKLILKTDWKVYERGQNWDTLVVDPSVNFPVYQVSYNWENWTYADAQRGTVQDLVAKYEWDELKSYTVFTDRASYTYSSVKYVLNKSFSNLTNTTLESDTPSTNWYLFTKQWISTSTVSLEIKVDSPFAKMPIKIYAVNSNLDDSTIALSQVRLFPPTWYYYDAQLDAMSPAAVIWDYIDLSFSWDITEWILLEIPTFPTYWWYRLVRLTFTFTKKEWASTYWWSHGSLYIDMNGWPTETHKMTINWVKSDWDYNEYYSYLPVRERELVSVWDYGYSESFWMKWTSFQPLYKWTWTWVNVNWEKKIRYDFVTDMGWESDVSMDVIGMMIWNEQVYMIWNMDWNWYIIPCDLTWWRWTPFIAYGCEFKWVTNIDYLLYLVWEDRGVSTLWVFNQQELVPILWWKQEVQYIDRIWVDEQYRFDWKIINRRKNLILTTTDNRIFQYGQTYGGKWWSFIHGLPSNAVITWLNANGNDLAINYSVTVNNTTTYYVIKYQDDAPIKNYNTEWQAVYPIVLWNHLLEKEESDLYASYILPASSCKLEFWGMANHYHFWTFTSEDDATLSTSTNYKLKWSSGTYNLKFLERNWNQYTFRLEWDLPVQTTNDMEITDSNNVDVITYSDFSHFRKIWVIETDKYQEWEFRFHNLNNKLELPKSHSLQIMVKGIGTANYTPELFSVDLVANQRERW